MAYYPRPDGLFDVDLPTGQRVPMALTAQQLEAAGHMPAVPAELQGLPPGALAQGPKSDQQAIADALNNPAPPAPSSGPKVDYAFGPNESAMPPKPGMVNVTLPGGQQGQLPAFDQRQLAADVGKALNAPQTVKEPGVDPNDLVPIHMQSMGAQAGGSSAPARVLKIKGGDTRASFVRVPGIKVGDDVKADFADTTPEDLEIGADRVLYERAELRQEREKQLLEQQQQIDKAKGRRAEIDRMIASKRDLIDQRDKEAEKLTPQTAKEVLEDRGVLGRVLAGITIALGGYLQGMQGSSRNPGLDMIREGIRDEVDDQRARYEDAIAKGETARNDYARALEIYGSPEAAAMDLEMRRLGVAEKLLLARAEGVEDQQWLMNVQQQAADLRKQRGELKLKLQELESGKVLQENWMNVPDRYVTTGGGGGKVKDQDLIVRLPNGRAMQAPDATTARSARAKIQANARLATLANRLKGLTDTIGKREPTAAERSAAETIRAEMMFTYKDAAQAGALDKGLVEQMDKYFGTPEGLLHIQDVGSKLGEVERLAKGKIADTINYELFLLPEGAAVPAMTPMVDSTQIESDE